MSVVTDVVLTFSLMEDEQSILAAVNAFPRFYNTDDRFILPDEETAPHCYGGSRCTQRHILIAAFNHFPADEFRNHMLTVPWCNPGAVQIMIGEEWSDHFEMWSRWGAGWYRARRHPLDEEP